MRSAPVSTVRFGALQRRMQEGPRRAPALAVLLGEVVAGHALLLGAVEVAD